MTTRSEVSPIVVPVETDFRLVKFRGVSGINQVPGRVDPPDLSRRPSTSTPLTEVLFHQTGTPRSLSRRRPRRPEWVREDPVSLSRKIQWSRN